VHNYLLAKYQYPPFVVRTKWTYRKGPKANLAVLKEPLRTSLWVEVQVRRLTCRDWKRKLKRASKFSDNILVVLTQNTITDYEMIRAIVSEFGIVCQFLFFDTRIQKLFEVRSNGEKVEIRMHELRRL